MIVTMSKTAPRATERGIVTLVIKSSNDNYMILRFTDEEFENWTKRLPEGIAHTIKQKGDHVFGGKSMETTTKKRKRSIDDDTTVPSVVASSTAWDRVDLPPEFGRSSCHGSHPPAPPRHVFGHTTEYMLRAWGHEPKDYLRDTKPLPVEELPVECRGSLAGRHCVYVTLFNVPYVYSFPESSESVETFMDKKSEDPFWEPEGVWFEGALQNGRLCICPCTHSTNADLLDTADVQSTRQSFVRLGITTPHSESEWTACVSCGRFGHVGCVHFRHRTLRDPTVSGWICERALACFPCKTIMSREEEGEPLLQVTTGTETFPMLSVSDSLHSIKAKRIRRAKRVKRSINNGGTGVGNESST